MDQDKNIEEILLEVGFSSGSAPKPDEPDVDRLLKEILAEQTEYKPAPPQPEGKKQNASTGSPVRAGTEKHTTEEPPTKVFKTGTFRKKRPAPAQPAPAKEPPFFRKAETIRETISGKTPRSFQADEKKPAQTEAAKPLDGKKETFSIDIDAIRAGQPAPKMIPAQKLEDCSEGERLRPVDLLRKKPPRPPEDQPEKESYAPCFQRLGQRAASEEPGQQEVILRKEARISLIMGLSVGLLTVMILVITMFTGLRREADAAFVPGRATLAVVTLLGAAAGGLSWEMVGGGIWSLLRFRPDRNTMPAIGYLVCLLQSIGQLIFPKGLENPAIQIYMGVGTLLLCGGWLARSMACKTAAVNAKFALSDYEKQVPVPVDDSRVAGEFTRGLVEGYGNAAVNCPTELLDGFLSIALGEDHSDRTSRNSSVAGLVLGAAAAVFTFLFTQHKNLAVTIFAAIVTVFTPMGNWFAVVHPLRRGAAFLNRLSAIASGERCIKDYSEVNAVVVDATELIPPASVTLSGIKTFAGMRIDEAILDAASALIESGSVLSDVFLRIIARRTELLRKVDAITYEDGMGISAWIGNRRILIGNRALMSNHGIRAPSQDYERRFREEGSDLVYLATSGELTAVFVITLTPSPEADQAIQLLVENDIFLSVHTTDAFLTAERLGQLYLCEKGCFKILPARLHDKFVYYRQPVKIKPAVVVNNGSIRSMAASLAVPRRLKIMASIAGVIQLVSVILGTAIVLMLALLGATAMLSPVVLAGWTVGWMLLLLLAQKLVHIQ